MAEANVSPQISVVNARLDISFATMSREINACSCLRNAEPKPGGLSNSEIIREDKGSIGSKVVDSKQLIRR